MEIDSVFLEDAGHIYWDEVTKCQMGDERYKWEASIAIELAKKGCGVVWKQPGTDLRTDVES